MGRDLQENSPKKSGIQGSSTQRQTEMLLMRMVSTGLFGKG
jgi:hypothetical protein